MKITKNYRTRVILADKDRSLHLFRLAEYLSQKFDFFVVITPYHYKKNKWLDFLLDRINKKGHHLQRNTSIIDLKKIATVYPVVFVILKFLANTLKISHPINKLYNSFFINRIKKVCRINKPSILISNVFNKDLRDFCVRNDINTVLDITGASVDYIIHHLDSLITAHPTHKGLIEATKSRLLLHYDNYKQVLNDLDYFLVPSENSSKSLTHIGIEENKIFRIPYGVESILTEKRIVTDFSKINLIFLGRIEYLKGSRFLLDVLESEIGDRFSVSWIGSFSSKEEILEDYTGQKLLGYLTKDEISREFLKAHFLILPSISEGMSYSVLEAMSNGIPAIVSSRSGFNNVIEDSKNGFIFESGDTQSLYFALRRVINSIDKYDDLSENALLTASKYTWERYFQTVEYHLLEIIGSI